MSIADLLKALKELHPDRLARAEEQGFDTNNIYFHGGKSDISEVDPNYFGRGADLYGPGFYTTKSPTQANNYTNGLREGEGGGNVMPVFLNKQDHLNLSNEKISPRDQDNLIDILGERAMRLDSSHPNQEMTRHFSNESLLENPNAYLDKAKELGLTGYTPSDVVSVNYDPSKVRSIFADFDPAKKESNDLLASLAGAGGLGAAASAMAPDEAEASPLELLANLKKLDPERLARAKAQGFDISKIVFHGTPFAQNIADKKSFKANQWFTEYPEHANEYAANPHKFDNRTSGVFPVFLKKGKQYIPEPGIGAEAGDFNKSLPIGYSMNKINPSIYDLLDGYYMPPSMNKLKKQGYDSQYYPEHFGDEEINSNSVQIAEPSQARSIFADFDPNKINSKDLMAGLAGISAGATALSPDQAQAAEHESIPDKMDKMMKHYQNRLMTSVQDQSNDAANDVMSAFEPGQSLAARAGKLGLGTLKGIGIPEMAVLDAAVMPGIKDMYSRQSTMNPEDLSIRD